MSEAPATLSRNSRWPRGRREIFLASFLTLSLLLRQVWPRVSWGVPLLAVATVAAFWPTFVTAVDGLRHRRFTIELFNGLAVAASLALQEWNSAAFIALMLTAARLLGEVTKSRSRRALRELMSLRPTKIYVERGGVIVALPPADLRPDDLVVVREGEGVPVDGDVVEGEAVVNEAPVTGESRPVLKVRGHQVLSPSLVERGTLKVHARRVGADTTLERIIRLVEEAQAARVPVLRLADRFAAYFFPVVIILAIAAYLVTGTSRAAIAILVVVCADDIAVSIPLAFLAAVGAAARRGIIVNGSVALERLGHITTVFFDKTGTLTYGSPRVEATLLASGVDDREFWHKVGSLEKYSKHPYARALLAEVAARHIVPPDPEGFKTWSGRGIEAQVEGLPMLAGSRVFLEERGVGDLPPDGDGEGQWYFAAGGRFFGRVLVNDLPRAGAKRALADLTSHGVRHLVMLTGDNPETAARVAQALGLKEVRARLLPDDKLTAIAAAKRAGEVVAMVGDGINDAPALAAADVGVAMGEGGTTVAVETAQVVIMHDDLGAVTTAIRLSRNTRQVVIGDFVIWGVSNAVGVAMVFLGILGPAAAAFYNFATDFLPMINSARIFGWHRRK